MLVTRKTATLNLDTGVDFSWSPSSPAGDIQGPGPSTYRATVALELTMDRAEFALMQQPIWLPWLVSRLNSTLSSDSGPTIGVALTPQWGGPAVTVALTGDESASAVLEFEQTAIYGTKIHLPVSVSAGVLGR